MPIYAYRCTACGHAKDVLQKISDPLLTICPACGADAFRKQLTAAGFQLKGSGWYVTDFKGDGPKGKNGKAPEPEGGAVDKAPASGEGAAAKTDGGAAASTTTAAKETPAPSPAKTPSGPSPSPSSSTGG